MGRTLTFFNATCTGRPLRVATVGLGVGTLATYARAGDQYRFYEINPDIPRLAQKYFTYLSDCRGECEIVMGDARLSLEQRIVEGRPPGVRRARARRLQRRLDSRAPFDRRGLHGLRQHLAPDGVIAVHVSNNHLNLAPVVRGLAAKYGLQIATYTPAGSPERLRRLRTGCC